MKLRAFAMTTLAAALPLAGIVATASPAAAANCTYPATAAPYGLRISPAQYSNPFVIHHGARVVISVRVVKGSLNCGGKNVYLYVHGKGEAFNSYHLSKTGTTTSNGLVSWTYNNQQNDFRYYAVLEGTGGSVRSQTGLIQVRG